MQNKKWVQLLAYVTGLVNQQLLLQNEYLAAENRILRSHLPTRLRLSDPERSTLAEMGKRLGRRGLAQVAGVARPDTILAWYRRLIARKFDGSKRRSYPGRPTIEGETEALIVRMARENSGWRYDRIVGALANLGHRVSDQTVANVLRRYGIAPAPKRCQKTTWKEFISAHLAVLAGTDFFTLEVLTWRGLATYYVLFFLQLETRRVSLAGITRASHQRVDDANGAQRDGRGMRVSTPTSVRASRLRHEVRRGFSGDFGRRRGEVPATPSAKPELECFCGTLGAIGQRGVPIEADLVRGSFVEEGANRIPRALPRRKKSSGQGQQAAVSSTHSTGISPSWEGSMPGAIRWAAQVL